MSQPHLSISLSRVFRRPGWVGSTHGPISCNGRWLIVAAAVVGSIQTADADRRALAQVCGWGEVSPEPRPSARSGHTAAFDEARGVTVIFGGTTGSDVFDPQTWTWDGEDWSLRASTGPSGRTGSRMVYDSARRVCVLFGGYDGVDLLGDTWEWDGASWTLRTTTGPSPRYVHGMAYDTSRGVTVLYGGDTECCNSNGETWEWDGGEWTQRSVRSPRAKAQHAMAYDEARGVTVMFGGLTFGGDGDRETWEFDGTGWTLRSSSGPAGRWRHGMVFDSARGVIVLFGGYDSTFGQSYDDTWEWDGFSWRFISNTEPPARFSHALTYDAFRGVTVLFGGFGAPRYDDTWEYCTDVGCEGIKRLKVKVVGDSGRCKLKGVARTTLSEGTELTLCFDDEACGCVTATVNANGRARATCVTESDVEHHVCIRGCPIECRRAACPP